MVGRCRLAGKEKCPRGHLQLRILPQPVVEHDDAQGVEELPFIFMDAFDLTIEDGVRINGLAALRLKPLGKLHFCRALRLADRVAEPLVAGQFLELGQLGEIGNPAVADGLSDGVGERRVRQQQPPSRRDPVGLVVEPLGIQLSQIFYRCGA